MRTVSSAAAFSAVKDPKLMYDPISIADYHFGK